MADLREVPVPRPSWVAAPDPWWRLPLLILLGVAAGVLIAGTVIGVVYALASVFPV